MYCTVLYCIALHCIALQLIILYRSSGEEEREIFANFELFPYFNIDVQPELINNNFGDKKESLISRRRNANDNSSNKKDEI